MKLAIKVFLLAGIVVGVLGASFQHAAADTFNQNRIIDDAIFDSTNTMSAAQINSFLNQFGSSCISPNNGFSAPDPVGYNPNNGYLYGGAVSAGQVIYDAAQAYSINPQVLLTTLQKEEGTVEGNGPYGCSALALSAAAGYACTDSDTASHTYTYTNGTDQGTLSTPLFYSHGNPVTSVSNTCVNSSLKAGFTEQLIRAAWLFKFGEQRSQGNVGWAVIKGNWDNSDDPQTCYGGPMTQGTFQRCPSGSTVYYDGYITVDNSAVHMDTGATAALYWYTPHFHGNQNFFDLFTSWFGSATVAYTARNYSQSPNYSEGVGWSRTVHISYQNSGGSTWYDDTYRPNGYGSVHLATANPMNMNSPFAFNWPSANRPAKTFSKVYEADGQTLAPDQHAVQPGEVAEFDFVVAIPENYPLGTYQLSLQPVIEGTPYWNMGGGASLAITAVPSYLSTASICPAPVNAQQNDTKTSALKFYNTGTSTWYDDTYRPNGYGSVHLATANPMNMNSPFAFNWPSADRPAKTFSKVYEADGQTLAPDQHAVQPGEVAEFDFTAWIPDWAAPGQYKQELKLIVEGLPSWDMLGSCTPTYNVSAAQHAAAYYRQSVYPRIAKGQTGDGMVSFKNTGTSTWYDDTIRGASGLGALHLAVTNPPNMNSPFAFNWPSANRPAKTFSKVYEADGQTLAPDQHAVQPGEVAEFDLQFANNSLSSNQRQSVYLTPVLEGIPRWQLTNQSVWLDIIGQ